MEVMSDSQEYIDFRILKTVKTEIPVYFEFKLFFYMKPLEKGESDL